jgi:hypothetical protein
MSEHLGYDKHHPSGRNHGNSRNGVRSKTVLTEIGPSRSRPRDLDVATRKHILIDHRSSGKVALHHLVPLDALDLLIVDDATDAALPRRALGWGHST